MFVFLIVLAGFPVSR